MCKMVQYTDGKYVADIKLRHIKNISEKAKKATHIYRIMLFGSSVMERCKDRSYINIAVFGDKLPGKYTDSEEFQSFIKDIFSFDLNQVYDVLYFQYNGSNKQNIMHNINSGVEIYRRSAE